MASRSRTTRSRSQSQEPEDEVPNTTTTSRRVTRGRVTRTSTVHRSIAETDLETDTGAEEGPASSSDAQSSGSDSEGHAATNTQKSSYSFGGGLSARSPYVTRSSSKSRTTHSYSRSAAYRTASSPTKALSFHEGDEDVAASSDDAGLVSPRPVRRSFLDGSAPPTPGELEAHEDADVYMLDCCDSHEVKRPDGTIAYRRHAHGGHSHARSASRPIADSAKAKQNGESRGPRGLVWYVLLSLLMVSMLGPWALKQITHRQPSFVGDKDQPGAIITQADLDKIISHVLTTMRSDLAAREYVDEPRLSSVTSSLSDRLTSERVQHVKTAVSDAVRQVYGKIDADFASENIEDAATLAATRRELVDLIDARTKQAASEWSTRLDALPKPQQAKEVDEAGLERRIADRLKKDTDQSDRLEALQARIEALQAELQATKALATQAEKSAQSAEEAILAKPTPVVKDYSSDLSSLEQQIASLRAELGRAPSAAPVDVGVINSEISKALERYSADRTSLVDYALRSSGGRILAHSPSHQVQLEGHWLLSAVKKCFMTVRKPEELLNDNMAVGSCWPMAGHDGYVAVGLRERIVPTSVSLQHIAREIAPDYTTTPKEFTVWGLDEAEFTNLRQHSNADPIGTQLGRFTYSSNSTQLQTFQLTHPNPAEPRQYSIITVGFQSNYGNPSYTCIYRVRVHGYHA